MMVIHIKFSSVKNLLDINFLNVRPPCSFLLNLVENSAVICWSIRVSKHSLWQRNVAKRFYCLVSKWVALPSCSLCWGFEHNFVIFNDKVEPCLCHSTCILYVSRIAITWIYLLHSISKHASTWATTEEKGIFYQDAIV